MSAPPPNINVRRGSQAAERLVKLKASLEAARGRSVTWTELLEELLDHYSPKGALR